MKITGSIVTYNNADIIEKTIESILYAFSSFPDFVLYIVDNHSSDTTLNILKKFVSIKVIELDKNIGFGAAHNLAIKYINHEGIHLIINPDISIPEDHQFIKAIEYLEQHPKVGLLSPKILNLDKSIQYLPKAKPTIFRALNRFVNKDKINKTNYQYLKLDMDFSNAFPIEYASGSFMIFRSSVLKKIDGFDERYFLHFEDADITRKTLMISDVYYFPEFEVMHAWARENRKNLKVFRITITSMIKYFLKWGLW